jgi:hypothetical protein
MTNSQATLKKSILISNTCDAQNSNASGSILCVPRQIFADLENLKLFITPNYNSKELHKLYSSPKIIRMIKSRRMRRAGHTSCMGTKGMHIGLWKARRKEAARKS